MKISKTIVFNSTNVAGFKKSALKIQFTKFFFEKMIKTFQFIIKILQRV